MFKVLSRLDRKWILVGAGAVVIATIFLASRAGRPGVEPVFAIDAGARPNVGNSVRNRAGSVLVGVVSGSEVLVKQIDPDSNEAKTVATFTAGAGNLIRGITLATRVDDDRSITMAVVSYCATAFNSPRPGFEGERICPIPLQFVSFELDSDGKRTGELVAMPSGIVDGFLFAGRSVFVWLSSEGRFIYQDGRWGSVGAEVGLETPGNQCISRGHLWVLHQNQPNGGNGEPLGPGYSLFRYPLDGALDHSWERVAVPPLDDAGFGRFACSEDEVYLWDGTRIFSTKDPSKPLDMGGEVYRLRPNPALRPVAFLRTEAGQSNGRNVYEDFRCTILAPAGVLVPSDTELPGQDSDVPTICDAVPWPDGRGGYTAIIREPLTGRLDVQDWR
ncbi:MAG: hypothetical protein ACT4OM_07480 [Actinomycetota bacterium]